MKETICFILIVSSLLFSGQHIYSQDIPLPEHPRPDFQRENWINLNGTWGFAFDSLDVGESEKWFEQSEFDLSITVPFSWGSKLSGMND